ncbi:hypothetical protein [Chitinophaga nivalis]|uniref:Uncharacterized protein n=1 Tax=Chitinophaga nivalis TaxID=2991709 RepID=A0ABT3IQE5_9BACT|nr:hypothetical protein [Chitinophaga nivalis]MCW3464127.1 hypothetical protein [Chitinophaga nivalis]MCW3486183.1 hypothetical protein [Chitinophaga nivalis]
MKLIYSGKRGLLSKQQQASDELTSELTCLMDRIPNARQVAVTLRQWLRTGKLPVLDPRADPTVAWIQVEQYILRKRTRRYAFWRKTGTLLMCIGTLLLLWLAYGRLMKEESPWETYNQLWAPLFLTDGKGVLLYPAVNDEPLVVYNRLDMAVLAQYPFTFTSK